MEALDYLAMAILAIVFIGISFGIYSEYMKGSVVREFEAKAELLAQRVEALGAQDVGSTDYVEIYVPQNCELSFSDNAILVRIGSSSRNLPVGIQVSGPVFSNQSLNLKIQRTENGVSVNVA